jgi:hypothetical protein
MALLSFNYNIILIYHLKTNYKYKMHISKVGNSAKIFQKLHKILSGSKYEMQSLSNNNILNFYCVIKFFLYMCE